MASMDNGDQVGTNTATQYLQLVWLQARWVQRAWLLWRAICDTRTHKVVLVRTAEQEAISAVAELGTVLPAAATVHPEAGMVLQVNEATTAHHEAVSEARARHRRVGEHGAATVRLRPVWGPGEV